jgi:hypothetical protein
MNLRRCPSPATGDSYGMSFNGLASMYPRCVFLERVANRATMDPNSCTNPERIDRVDFVFFHRYYFSPFLFLS